MDNIESLRKLAYELLAARRSHDYREKGFIYYHGQRVAKLAINLRKLIIPDDDSNDDVIRVASYFHDIAKGIEPHFEYGAILVKEILKEYFTEEELKKIVDIVRYHTLRRKDNDYADYIKIVQDADILDHYGTIGVWLDFHYYAYHDLSMEKALEIYEQEYEKQISKVRELLNYDISKKIYDDRVEFQRKFFRRFAVEVKGDIFTV